MKTRFKRIGKSSVSVLLAVLMMFSSMLVGTSATIENEKSGASVSKQQSASSNPLVKSNTTMLVTAFLSGSDTYHDSTALHMWNSNGSGDITSNYPAMNDADAPLTGVRYYKPDEGTISDSNGNYIKYAILKNSGSWNNAWQRDTDSSFVKGSQFVAWRTSSKAGGTFEVFTPLEITSLDAADSSIVNAENTITINVDGGIPWFYLTKLKNAQGYNDYNFDDYGYKLTVTDNETAVLSNQVIKYSADNHSYSFNWTPETVGNHVLKFTLTDYSSADTIEYTKNVNVTANTIYNSISVAAKSTEDGSLYTTNSTPTVTIDGGTVSVSVTGSTGVAAPASFESGGNTYKFYEWAASAGGTFGNSKSASTTFSPADDGEIATAKYKRCYSVTCFAATNGTISAAESPVAVGENYTINITPDSGYAIDTLTVNGSTVTPTNNAYTAPMPQDGVSVTATFKKATYRLYFYDANEWGYTHIHYWDENDNTVDKNNTPWPGVAMTPDEKYINLYYIDIDNTVTITNCIFNNITHFFISQTKEVNQGGQTGTISCSLSTNNGQVFVPTSNYNSNNGSWGSWVTLQSLIDNGTLKEYGDSSYYRVYFYNQSQENNWKQNNNSTNTVYSKVDGNTYMQFGTRSGSDDSATITFSNYAATKDVNSSDWNYGSFPGKAMTPMSNTDRYNSGGLFYVDIPTGEYNFVRFTRGYFSDGANMTKLHAFSSAKNNYVFQLNDSNTGSYKKYDTGYSSSEIGTVLSGGQFWEEFQGNETHNETASSGNVNVWAKRGTTRNGGESRNRGGTYSEYVATTTVEYADANDGTLTTQSKFYNTVTYAEVPKGKTIKVTTTIDQDKWNKLYVKAFIVNGETIQETIINEPSYTDQRRVGDTNGENGGIYSFEYTIPSNTTLTDFEITPVFFYLTDTHSSNKTNEYITFYAEDFIDDPNNDADVVDKWGSTLAVYAWYSDDKTDDYTDGERGAIGGYPGQPMIYQNGSYFMQIPKYSYYSDGTKNTVQGVTMNNYYWDDVHFFKGNIGDAKANCQTYDYDDFVALLAYSDKESIIFNFKYRNQIPTNTASVTADGQGINKGNDHWNTTEGDNRANFYNGNYVANGWNALVDYYDYSVDLFGNRVYTTDANNEKTYYSETEIVAKERANNTAYSGGNDAVNEMLYIVSNGYEIAENDYIGYYATKWYVYDWNGDYLGAFPPSAFVWDVPDGDLPNDAPDGFLGYSTKASGSSQRSSLWSAYKAIANQKDSSGNYLYRNKPAVITYETAIADKGTREDYGLRSDGRWYFSKKNATIYANIKIQIAEKQSNGTYTYTYDTIPDGTHQGTTTGANAYFTNDDFSGAISSGNVKQTPSDSFRFTADLSSTATNGDEYEFKGWYKTSSLDNTFSTVSATENGSRAMVSIETFIARYEKVSKTVTEDANDGKTKSLTITHELYANADKTGITGAPTVHNGTGTTKVASVTINYTAASGKESKTIDNSTSSLNVKPDDLNFAENITITLTSTPKDSATSVTAVYYKNTSSFDANSSANKETVTYTYTIAQLFPGTGTTESATLKYYADFTTTSITLKVKYYDRDIVSNTPTTIKQSPRVLTIPLDLSGNKTIPEALTEKANEINTHVDNIIDSYKIWPSQTAAKAGIKDLPDLRSPADDNTLPDNKTTAQDDKEYVRYSAAGYTSANFEKHTDYFGVPQGYTNAGQGDNKPTCAVSDGEDWVSYTDASGNPVSYTKDTENNADILSDAGSVATVTIWAYNTPKTYKIDVYAPDTTAATPETLTNSYSVNGLTLYCNPNGGKYVRQRGYYNQRLGGADSVDPLSDNSVAYLTGYGSIGGYVGNEIEADETIACDSSNDYIFDGWYACNATTHAPIYKITTDKNYGFRITTDLSIVACYQKVEKENTAQSRVGLTVTNNGVDYYALNGVNKVRLNTQVNTYGVDNSDHNIKQISAIYVRLPATYTDVQGKSQTLTENDTEILNAIQNQVKVDVETRKLFAEPGSYVDVVDVTIGDGNNPAGYISFTYDVVWPDTSSTSDYQANLTNKNRANFVINSTVDDYNAGGRNSAIIVFAAMRYDDRVYETSTDESSGVETTTLKSGSDRWIVSDNYASYITNK